MPAMSEFNLTELQAMLMSLQQNTSIVWTVLAVSGLFLLLSTLLMIRGRRRLLKHLHEIQELQRDMRAITAAAIGVGERVLEIERRQRRLSERQEQLDIYDSANQPYEQAISMIKHGADVAELVEVCGISESEAELVALMHRLDQTA